MSDRRRRRFAARPEREDHDRRPDRTHGSGLGDARGSGLGDERASDDAPADGAPEDREGLDEALREYERRRDELLGARRRDRDASRDGEPPRAAPERVSTRRAGGASRTPRASGTPAAPPPSPVTPAPPSAPAPPSRHTPRAIRRDGPGAWFQRRYRRFRRSLRANLTAYGHRYNAVGPNAAADPKPLLLWLVDLPRLAVMWGGHLDYRATRAATLLYRDLRSRPPRIQWNPAEVLSPHVAFAVPTAAQLDPFWRWPRVRAFARELRTDWRTALAGAGAAAAAAVDDAKQELAADLSVAADRTGRSLSWGQAQLTRFDRLFRPARRDDRAWWFACGTGLCGLILTGLLFLRAEPARAGRAAAAPGTGAALADLDPADRNPRGLVPDAAFGVPPALAAPSAAEDWGEEFDPDPAADPGFGLDPGFDPASDPGFDPSVDPFEIARADSDPEPFDPATDPGFDPGADPVEIARGNSRSFDPATDPGFDPDSDPTAVARGASNPADADPYGGLPDPFAAGASSDELAGPLPDESAPGDPGPGGAGPEEFDWGAPLAGSDPGAEAYVRSRAELSVGLRRTELPPGEPGYVPPDDDAPLTATAAPVGGGLPEDPGGWLRQRVRRDRYAPAVPPEYVGPDPADPDGGADLRWDEPAAAAPPRASDVPADGVPAAAGAGLTVARRTPATAARGQAYRYQLWVENPGAAPAAATVTETVGPGVRVTAAEPPAAFAPAAASETRGGGTLTWDLPPLDPGEVRRLTVTVFPLPNPAGKPGNGAEAGGDRPAAFTTEARVTGRWAVAALTDVARPEPADEFPADEFPADEFPAEDFPDEFPTDESFPGGPFPDEPAAPAGEPFPAYPADPPPFNDFADPPGFDENRSGEDRFGEEPDFGGEPRGPEPADPEPADPAPLESEPLDTEAWEPTPLGPVSGEPGPADPEPFGEPASEFEPRADERPSPAWNPQPRWEPQPLPDAAVRPAQILTRTPEPEADPDAAGSRRPPRRSTRPARAAPRGCGSRWPGRGRCGPGRTCG